MSLSPEDHGKITRRIEELRARYGNLRNEILNLRTHDDDLVSSLVRDLEGLRDGDARECASSLAVDIKVRRLKEHCDREQRRLEMERQYLIEDILTLRGLL